MSGATRAERGVSRPRSTIGQKIAIFFGRHFQTAIGALGRLYRAPISSLLTIMVIGIALALPSALYLVLKNFDSVLGQWNPNPKISLYLQESSTEPDAIELTRALSLRSEIASVEYISPENGMREVAETTGIHNILDILGENPLPRVIVIMPDDEHSSPARIKLLHAELVQLPSVQSARLDLAWVERLHGYMGVAKRGFMIIAILLALSVLLIVGNTIRLEIFNREDEIIICKLIGATNAFIRRPFLYSGLWYGFTGGMVAWLILFISVLLIRDPVAQLTLSYNSPFQIQGLAMQETGMMLLIALGLGFIGSFSSVSRHLKKIEPK